jgi:hypothetical protein
MSFADHQATCLQSQMRFQGDLTATEWLKTHPPGTLYEAAVRKATIAHYQRLAASALQNGFEVAQINQTLRGLGALESDRWHARPQHSCGRGRMRP